MWVKEIQGEVFTHMRLKDVVLRSAKAKAKPYRLPDGNGLYLLVHPNGGKYWQFRFRYHQKEKLLSLGAYPEVSLQEARDGRDEARKLLRSGKDPASERKIGKLRARAAMADNFKAIAKEWLETRRTIWTERHTKHVTKRLEYDIYPEIGDRAIREIKPLDLLLALRKIEIRGTNYTAHQTQQIVGQVFRYAVAWGKVDRDITPDLRGALTPAKKKNHTRLSANELPEFLEKLAQYDGDEQTQNAVRLLMLTFVRTTELRAATWKEFDFEKAEWRIPAARMKMRLPHIVPLSPQALNLFRKQRETSGNSEFVFPNRTNPRRVMSENTILYAIYRIGYHSRATGHGFRGTASTVLHESGFKSEVIERQLAHRDTNAVRASYNHAEYMSDRREMLNWWADYLQSAGMSFK